MNDDDLIEVTPKMISNAIMAELDEFFDPLRRNGPRPPQSALEMLVGAVLLRLERR